MILRVPDYYDEFRCIADRCKDSCCIGWEIDIDEDTHAYYQNVEGTFGERLKKNMVPLKEGGFSFGLVAHNRCPFLNDKNLCDICIELGEEALSEVCTEYPRFSLYYGNVLQKCLSLSCEEVGRILFEKKEKISFVDYAMSADEDERLETWEEEGFAFFETLQKYGLLILQNREVSIWDRMVDLQGFLAIAQDFLDQEEDDKLKASEAEKLYQTFITVREDDKSYYKEKFALRCDYAAFAQSLAMFSKMEVLDHEWSHVKNALRDNFTEESYARLMESYLEARKEEDMEIEYEQLMVYFFFRYFMQSVYDFKVLSKGAMAVEFTMMLRDMDALRFMEKKAFEIVDRIDTARIFSKEVEHSEENVTFAEESIAFCLL